MFMLHCSHIQVNMVVVGGLVPIWRQGINNHYVDDNHPRISNLPKRYGSSSEHIHYNKGYPIRNYECTYDTRSQQACVIRPDIEVTRWHNYLTAHVVSSVYFQRLFLVCNSQYDKKIFRFLQSEFLGILFFSNR